MLLFSIGFFPFIYPKIKIKGGEKSLADKKRGGPYLPYSKNERGSIIIYITLNVI